MAVILEKFFSHFDDFFGLRDAPKIISFYFV